MSAWTSPRTFARALAPRLARSIAAAAVTCLPVGVLAVLVTRSWAPLEQLDAQAIRAATHVTREHRGLYDALIVWQEVFQPWRVYLYTLPVVIWVWRRGLRARAAWGLVTMLVGWNLGLQVKLLVERARPVYDDPVSSAPGFSFPSGHAFNAAMATTALLICAWPLIRERRALRAALIGLGGLIVVATALDRVYLGVHFPTDVTAGVLLAFGLNAASYAGFAHRPGSAPPATAMQIEAEVEAVVDAAAEAEVGRRAPSQAKRPAEVAAEAVAGRRAETAVGRPVEPEDSGAPAPPPPGHDVPELSRPQQTRPQQTRPEPPREEAR